MRNIWLPAAGAAVLAGIAAVLAAAVCKRKKLYNR